MTRFAPLRSPVDWIDRRVCLGSALSLLGWRSLIGVCEIGYGVWVQGRGQDYNYDASAHPLFVCLSAAPTRINLTQSGPWLVGGITLGGSRSQPHFRPTFSQLECWAIYWGKLATVGAALKKGLDAMLMAITTSLLESRVNPGELGIIISYNQAWSDKK